MHISIKTQYIFAKQIWNIYFYHVVSRFLLMDFFEIAFLSRFADRENREQRHGCSHGRGRANDRGSVKNELVSLKIIFSIDINLCD